MDVIPPDDESVEAENLRVAHLKVLDVMGDQMELQNEDLYSLEESAQKAAFLATNSNVDSLKQDADEKLRELGRVKDQRVAVDSQLETAQQKFVEAKNLYLDSSGSDIDDQIAVDAEQYRQYQRDHGLESVGEQQKAKELEAQHRLDEARWYRGNNRQADHEYHQALADYWKAWNERRAGEVEDAEKWRDLNDHCDGD